jgi:glycosyltransferase involved in cell wall biosynthesis
VSLSAVIIAQDEANRIARCLESLRWADEIVVVVSQQTTDATAEIARRFTGRVLVRRFEGFSDQRDWADRQASGDWILSVDCDEVVPDDLAREIRETLAAPRYQAYRVPHLDYMFGKWIRHGGWYPQYHVRLYERGQAQWNHDVHEKAEIATPLGTLRHPIRHYSHGRVADWVAKMARYTSLEAEGMYRAGVRMTLPRLLAEPPLYSGYKYFWQQGWRDGAHGLVLALLLGCYRLVRNLKLWDLQQSQRGPVEPDDCPPPISRP